MSAARKKPEKREEPGVRPADADEQCLRMFAAEDARDRLALIVALGVSVIFHAGLSGVDFGWPPEPSDALAYVDQPEHAYQLKHLHFKLAPPAKQAIPKPRARKVPMPDPTPDLPEAEAMFFSIPAAASAPILLGRRLATTGGNAEPNGAPHGDMFFRHHGVNPFIDTDDDALSTFGLDVDTGSYTVARRYLRDGHLPPPDAVRVEEFVNYFDYRQTPPQEADFAVYAEGAPAPYGTNERYHLLRFHLRGRTIEAADRPPADLTFVVDVSGSMAEDNRLGLVKRALFLLLDQLRADDRVALVVYGTNGRVLLEPTHDLEAIREAIGWLRSEGSTNAEEGLRMAYRLAASHPREGAARRVILCSDGVANVGRTGADAILARIRRQAEQGIELTTVGFGMGNYNDQLMERLADAGDGRYAYVDSLDEARRIFVEGLTGTLRTIASEAKAQVEFNPQVVSRYRLLGYENRAIRDQRFRDDTVDAGEIGAGHAVTALYEIKLHRPLERDDRVATLHLRYASVAAGEIVETAHRVAAGDFVARWESASGPLRLASLVAEMAEILRDSYWAEDGDLDDVFRRLQQVSAEFPGDREVADLVSLAGLAAELRRRAA